jgi:hypothetical protein
MMDEGTCTEAGVRRHGYQDPSQPLGKPVVVGDEAARKKLPEGKKW